MANTLIQLKRTSIAGRAPKGDQLDVGELAINLADRILYSKDTSNTVFQVASSGPKGDKGEKGELGSVDISVDSFTGTGSNTSFTLSSSPDSENYVLVTLNGVVQHKSSFTIAGNTLSFPSAPANNVLIEVSVFRGGAKGDLGEKGVKGEPGEAGSVVGGSNTQILFNDSGNANGTNAFTFDKTSNTISVGGNIIPQTDVTYDLGSANNRFRDLYLSGNTINLGNTTISSQNGAIAVPELVIAPAVGNVIIIQVSDSGGLNSIINGQNVAFVTAPTDGISNVNFDALLGGSSVGALNDVALPSTIINGQVLSYNSSIDKFVPATVEVGAFGNFDGGEPNSNYGGIPSLDAGGI